MLLLMGASFASIAQATESAAGPERTCLVLSGGGARGIAHVGVLKVLERERVALDCIVGTSMGAVIGSLYASGLSADEVEQAVLGIDWAQVFNDRPARLDQPLRRRELDRGFLVESAIGYRQGRFGIPVSLLQGQRLGLALRAVLLPTSTVDDFDALPIAFRAVATDLETGEGVVLGQGDLARAVRASMAVPGVFPPVEIDGRLLVDGGSASNLPVSIARQMGATRIIAVDISAPLRVRQDLNSPLAITDQMLTAMIRRQTEAEAALLQPGDLLLRPALGGLGSADFLAAARSAIAPGTAAAEAAQTALAAFALPREEFEALQRARTAQVRRLAELPGLALGDGPPLVKAALRAWQREHPDAEADLAALESKLWRIYGLDRFESVDYRWDDTEEGPRLALDLRERRFGDGGLAFGLLLQDDFDGNSTFQLGARLRDTEVNASGAEWLVEAEIGKRTHVGLEWLQPLNEARSVYALPSAAYTARSHRISLGARDALEYRRQSFELGADLGLWLGRWGQASLGAQVQQNRFSRVAGLPGLVNVERETAPAWRFGLLADTQDDLRFPRHGSFHRLGLRHYGGGLGRDFDASVLDYTGSYVWPLSEAGHLLLRGRLQHTWGGDAPLSELAYLGGFLNLSGYAEERLAGRHLALVQGIYHREAGRLFDRFRMFYGGSVEAGNTWLQRRDVDLSGLIFGASLFVAADSPLGALYFGYGQAERGENSLYLFIGRPY